MKKHLIIAGIICAASIPPAYAVTKCVKLTPSTLCTTSSSNGSNWYATCGGIAIQGVAFCGSLDGGPVGATTETVTTSSISDNNKYCWCKMVSPAVSRWVYSRAYALAGECASDCAYVCASNAQYRSNFRSGLYSGLSD